MEPSVIHSVSGREVWPGRFCLDDLWADILEGTPEIHAQYIRRSLLTRVQKRLGITEPVLIFDEGEAILPPFLCMAYLKSSAVKPGYVYSYAYVAWFVDSLDRSVCLLVQDVLKRFDWEAHAQEVHEDDL